MGFTWTRGASVLAALGLFLLMSRRKYRPILDRMTIRNDGAGLGHFGAPRRNRTHQGTDYLAAPGEPVFSPVTGTFIRTGRPYTNDPRYRLVVIHGSGLEFKLMYVDALPGLTPGTPVRAGEQIGTAQNVAAKYGPPMLNHVHVEVRRIAGADLIDPGTMFA